MSDENMQNVPPEQEIPYHKGAVNTLIKEREGLMQMQQVVEATLNGHLKRLKELGVSFDENAATGNSQA